ncbi:conjugal transfer protein TraF [Scandinavium goeteborgense]|uniref:conjugal transfer protein TraF n=1 Tax=Scandinavium goeteborgense TaxID=1851514 RepID=UPI001448011B|nr:conjugal transfer protein TraF [Scandinavium goeteborgense]
MYPTADNTATYLRLQMFWTDRGPMFRQSFAAAQLQHPDCITTWSTRTTTAWPRMFKPGTQSAISEMAQEYGLFYFCDPIDVLLAGVVTDFAKLNHISLIPVTIDCQVAPSVPESRQDTGQSKAMNVSCLTAAGFGLDIVNRSLWPVSSGRRCRIQAG